MKFLSSSKRHLWLAATAVILTSPFTAPANAETDYNLVGRHVALMLRNLHFNKLDFNEALSRKSFDAYLRHLDPQRLYLLESDVAEFKEKYSEQLHNMLIRKEAMDAATDIFQRFLQRVEERHDYILTLLDSEEFTFDSDREVHVNREDAPWAKNKADADQLWHAFIEDSLLREKMRELSQTSTDDEEKLEAAPALVSTPGDENRESLRQRFRRILENHRETNDEDVNDYFLTALSSVYDPHSEYLSHSAMEQFRVGMDNQLAGIGALLQANDDGTTQIKGIVTNGPVDRAKALQLDDKVIGVDTNNSGNMVDIMYMRLNKVVELIRGEPGTEVRLKVIPIDAPDTTTEVVITRDIVQLKDKLATAELIRRKNNDGIEVSTGWIKIPSFYADMEAGETGVVKDVRKLLKRLMDENIDALVIDLRGNGGGVLSEAIDLTGLFIPKGPVVVSKDSAGTIEEMSSSAEFPVYDGPLVILTDKTSASASEIFAAALQDYHRAIVVGSQSTFGKGTVQRILDVGNTLPVLANRERAGALKLTVQKFYRISGGSTQLRGVIPDIILPAREDALEIGEDALLLPLPFDEVQPRKYALWEDSKLYIPELKELSKQRITDNTEFDYIRDDIETIKKQQERTKITLNLEQRLEEQIERRESLRERNQLRREHFTQILEKEKDLTNVYRFTLDNIQDPELHPLAEFNDEDNLGMRVAKTDEEDPDESTPEFPFGFDPAKRETLNIVSDLVLKQKSAGAHTVQSQR